ncbi:thioredoxin family protein [Uliginosibacterium sp. sgz301328]|uniref:thioredoxin family protein n=1 Tax=Uliginosibacterium sp. sgz301328 TaxID=3243764 RepID=UPI00359DB875
MTVSNAPDLTAEFLVTCLCAQWCGSCREYRPSFEALAGKRPGVAYAWVDVEDEAEVAGDVDVDNFPTLVIQRGEHVLFCGPMIPDVRALDRLLASFMEQDAATSAAYAIGTPERRAWQGVADVRSRLREASR